MKKNAPFQNEGIMSISKALTTNVDSKVNRIVEGAKRQGIDFDKYNEQEVKYILELNKKKLEPRVISADSPEGRGITEALLGRKEGKVIKADFGKPFKEESDEIMKFKKIAEEDREIENLYSSAGFGNDQKVDADFLAEYLAENAGKVYDDLPTKERLDFYNRAYNALTRYKKTVGRSVIDEPKKLDPRTKEKIDDIDPEDMATGGRVGLKNGNKKITLAAKGTKSGRQQIKGAPEGITMDNETFNAIVNADIPITEKIDLLANFEYGKGRTRIEKDGQEIFMDEGGFKDRNIGLGFNKEGEGIGGSIMYNLETGDPQFNIGFRKKI